MTNGFMHLLRAGALTATIAVSGCSTNTSGGSDQSKIDAGASFDSSLRKCRRLQPGRLNQRMNLPPTSLRVAECLRRLGWQPDGSRHAPAIDACPDPAPDRSHSPQCP